MLWIFSDPPSSLPGPGSVFLCQTRPPSSRLRRGRCSLLNQPHALLHRRHFHPLIMRMHGFHLCQQFLWSESGSYLSLRQTLINSDAPSSRRVNKTDLHDLSSPLKQANLAPKSIPVANRSRKVRTLLARHNHCTTIVPHNTRECQVAAAGLQRAWAASLVHTAAKPHSLPASAHPSPQSPRPQRRMQPGLYLLFPDANTWRPPLAAQPPVLPNNSQVKSLKAGNLMIKVMKGRCDIIGC